MLVGVRAVSIVGSDAFPVEVETDLRLVLPRFVSVGLPDALLKESQERVGSAIKTSDLEWPQVNILATPPTCARRARPSTCPSPAPSNTLIWREIGRPTSLAYGCLLHREWRVAS
jgi:hypothetical protein